MFDPDSSASSRAGGFFKDVKYFPTGELKEKVSIKYILTGELKEKVSIIEKYFPTGELKEGLASLISSFLACIGSVGGATSL